MSAASEISSKSIDYFNYAQSDIEGSEKTLLQALEDLTAKKQALFAEQQRIQQSLDEITKQEEAIRAQIQHVRPSSSTEGVSSLRPLVGLAQRVAQFAGTTLVVNTAHHIKSHDRMGERSHYCVSLITNAGEEIQIDKGPIDIKKYGEIKQIVILEGEKETVLKGDENIFASRLIEYMSTDFDAFRKKINAKHIDRNGVYPNKYLTFDCNRFAFYLRRGEEGSYDNKAWLTLKREYREVGAAEHRPFSVYGMNAETAAFGQGGRYRNEDMSTHYYVCLTPDVFVSKYGDSEVLFTSYPQMLDAYFPPKFIRGSRWQEW